MHYGTSRYSRLPSMSRIPFLLPHIYPPALLSYKVDLGWLPSVTCSSIMPKSTPPPRPASLPSRTRSMKISRKLPDPDYQYASDSSDLMPTPPPRRRPPPPVYERFEDGVWRIDHALDGALSQASLVRCGLRTFLGIESSAVFGVLFIHKQPARHNPGLREKEKYTLFFLPAAHDSSNPISLVSFGPQVVLAEHTKYPHATGPVWTTRDHWTLENPFEFVTTHKWMKKWLKDIVRGTPQMTQKLRLCTALDWLRPIEENALAGFAEATRPSTPAEGDVHTEPAIKVEPVE